MSFPVIMIDYLNDRNEVHWDTIKRRVPNARRIEAIGTVEQSVKYAIDQYGPQAWIVSSHCDYNDFDFNFVPSKYDRKYLHIWSSKESRFGETFLFANPQPWDPWDKLLDLPTKYIASKISCSWDHVSWTRTGNEYLDDLCKAVGTRKGRVVFVHTNCEVDLNISDTFLDYKPKLVHLEDSDPCFTFLTDASWLKEQQLLQTDLDTLEDQIVIKAAKRHVTLPIVKVPNSDVVAWLDFACKDYDDWIIVAHDSVSDLGNKEVEKIWNTIYRWGNPDALHAFGYTCAMVFAVHAARWKIQRRRVDTLYDHPTLITHPSLGVQDPKNAITVKTKDFVQKFEWAPQNWDDMLGPVALIRDNVLLGVAGDFALLSDLELMEEDVWQWPNLRIVEVEAKILKRNLFNVKR